MGSVLTSSILPNVALPALETSVRIEALQVFDLGDADGLGRAEEIVFGALDPEAAIGDIDGAVVTVAASFARAMVCFKLSTD